MLTRILPVLIILLTLPAFGIERLSLRHRFKSAWRYLFYLPNAVLLCALIYLAIGEEYTASADYWKGQIITLSLDVLVPETILVLVLLLARLVKRWAASAVSAIERIGWGLALFFFIAMIYGSTLGYRYIVTRSYAYEDSRIPAAFDGYRIVQLSDLHTGTFAGREEVLEAIVDSVNALDADLVVFTGDLVNYRATEAEHVVPILRRIKARDGVISIMGNHDYAQYYAWASPADSLDDIRRVQQAHRDAGWHILLNENTLIHRGADSIAIVGVENDGRPPFPALADLPKAQAGLDTATFSILLSHDPTHWRRSVIPETKLPLMLAGHTHGMQFKVGTFSPASWFYREWGGAYTEGQQTLYISLGTGEVMLPFRLGAWPEINVITLKSPAR